MAGTAAGAGERAPGDGTRGGFEAPCSATAAGVRDCGGGVAAAAAAGDAVRAAARSGGAAPGVTAVGGLVEGGDLEEGGLSTWFVGCPCGCPCAAAAAAAALFKT